jgi:myo-inositol-hexaphosphate 3-phosphohydrolase
LQGAAADWSEDGCKRIVTLAQFTLAAGCLAATLLQFVGALYVREYAKSIWIQETSEDEGRAVELDSEAARMAQLEDDIEKR